MYANVIAAFAPSLLWILTSISSETGMVEKLTGGYKIKYHAYGVDKDPIEIDFSPPFRCGDVLFCFD